MEIYPALIGVGYICGPQISKYMFAGGTLSWFVLMPMIALFGKEKAVKLLEDALAYCSDN